MKKASIISVFLLIANIGYTQNQTLEKYFRVLEESGFSGIIAVGQNGEPWLTVGIGDMDKSQSKEWRMHTISTTGSITKQFTAVAILKLEEEGKLKVTDKISNYFDDVPVDKAEITIHHLLTHGAGLPGAVGDDYEILSAREFQQRAMNAELLFNPGEGYEYSNVGFTLAAMIVEQLSGKSYEEFLIQEFFKPAGMENTGYLMPKWKEKNMAFGLKGDQPWGSNYDRYKEKGEVSYHLIGNGGVLSTAEDMIKWDKALTSGSILSKESLNKVFTKHNPEPGGDSFYGYGYVVVDYDGGKLVKHNGGNQVFFADYLRFLDKDRVIYVMCNKSDRKFFDVAIEVARILDNADYEPQDITSKPMMVLDDLPDSPLSVTIRSFLNKLPQAKSDDEFRALVKDHLTDDFADQFSPREQVSMMKNVQEHLGHREIVKVEVVRQGHYKVFLADDKPETLMLEFVMGPSISEPRFATLGVDIFD